MGSWPNNVGILALELIFPSQYVDQTELETFNGVSPGKYTLGLGQKKMGFCTDREDINSLCLTVVQKLLERYNIKHSEIGRLEVGTETIIDKSKSVKSVLMQLFESHGVTDIEGIDTTNACYGGTASVLNSISWVESSAWDGRYALTVAADIAIYAKGPARPTGGAGAVAILIGPNAPIVFDRGLRASYMRHAYDFYKPDLASEYPIVDGKLSIQCYLQALDNCYQLYCKKASKLSQKEITINHFDAVIFHSPYCKLVQKSLARLLLNDLVRTPKDNISTLFPNLKEFSNIKLENTYFDRDIEKVLMTTSKDIFDKKTKESLYIASEIGNMYTASVYAGLISYLINKDVTELTGNKIALFSYGSGLASTFYSLTISEDCSENSSLQKLISNLSHIKPLLEKRIPEIPEKFAKAMEIREHNNHKAPYKPQGPTDKLFPGTYYLDDIDEMYRRTYKQVPDASTNGTI